jgi:hypothetical protein
VSTSLLSGSIQYSNILISEFSYHRPRVSYFSKELNIPVNGEWCLEIKSWVLIVSEVL